MKNNVVIWVSEWERGVGSREAFLSYVSRVESLLLWLCCYAYYRLPGNEAETKVKRNVSVDLSLHTTTTMTISVFLHSSTPPFVSFRVEHDERYCTDYTNICYIIAPTSSWLAVPSSSFALRRDYASALKIVRRERKKCHFIHFNYV